MNKLNRLSTILSIKKTEKSFLALCILLFFWALFDGSVAYITPLKITQSGYSETFMGFIIGSSSIFGAIFDFILSKYLTNIHFRRVFFIMIILCLLFPLLLSQNSLIFYLLAMAVWGIYYDLSNFGTFDFVGRKVLPEEHSKKFGFIDVFRSLGYILAPVIISLTIIKLISWQPFAAMFVFIGFAFIFLILLARFSRKESQEFIHTKTYKNISLLKEMRLWKNVGIILLPVLLLTFFYNIFDSFFWTIGPILAEGYKELHPFNGLFLTFYSLPPLFVGWFVGNISQRYGKKRSAIIAFAIGSFLLTFFPLFHNPFIILISIFCVGIFTSFCFPAVDGAYADYISETALVEKEIEALVDFFTNLGYIIGPMIAGYIADTFGNAQAFSLLGIACCSVSLILLILTPRHIRIPSKVATT